MADLLDGAGLEHDVRDPGLVQVLDDVDGVLELGDAGADHQAVEGSTGEARLLQQALATDVQLPQVRVEQERVELRRAALVEELGQLGHVLVEDPLGHLATAGELGPVAGVRGSGDDLGVDGGRGHPGEQDRRLAGEPGERGVHDGLAVAAVDQPGGVRRPVGRLGHGSTGGEEQVATGSRRGRDDRDAATTQRAAGHVGGELSGTEVDDPAGLRADRVGELARPVDGLHADGVGEVLGETGVETAGLGPVASHGHGRGKGGVVEAERDRHRLHGGAERAPATDLGLDIGGLGGAALLDGGAQAAQDCRGATDDEAARTVDGAHGGHVGGVGDLGDELFDVGEVGAADGEHGGLLTVRHQAGAAADDGGCGADEAGDGEQLDVAAGVSGGQVLAAAREGGDAEDALGVADRGHRRDLGEVHALGGEQVKGGELGEQHAGHAESGADRVGLLRGGLLLEPHLRLERTRECGGQLAGDGGHPVGGLLDEVGQAGGVGVLAGQLAQGGEPVGALSSEGDGELLALGKPLGQ